jgi:hypothetical protein
MDGASHFLETAPGGLFFTSFLGASTAYQGRRRSSAPKLCGESACLLRGGASVRVARRIVDRVVERAWPTSMNNRIRLLSHRSFGLHSAEALITGLPLLHWTRTHHHGK